MQRRDLRISYRRIIERPLKEIYAGQDMQAVRNKLDAIHAELRNSRLFVATHMHAGDGNVHTNIPVNSNDYEMLHEADRVVERIMNIATSLGGVVSGEHGIGITKFQFLGDAAINEFADYKNNVDPAGRFNSGKLAQGSGLENAYTPSLRLLQQEALILEASELGDLNNAIKDCLRCGKCKPVCTTHIPAANLLYSPRNKILATGLIIEAFLYEEQTRRGISVRHFDEMNDIADHCTVCHKCAPPLPGQYRLWRRLGSHAFHSYSPWQETQQSWYACFNGLPECHRSHYSKTVIYQPHPLGVCCATPWQ